MESSDSELFKQHEVKVCTANSLFSGMLQCGINQRLIDTINEGIPYGTSSRSLRFLQLTDACDISNSGVVSMYTTLYVAKSNIIFIGRSQHETRESSLTSYPYRPKASVSVIIVTAPYTIRGNVHVDTWGQLPDTLEAELMFLPITQAAVTPAPPGGQDNYIFMAINRNKIIYLHEAV